MTAEVAEEQPARRFGDPIEVPWWALVIAAPPLILIVLSLVFRASIASVALGLLGSLLMLVTLYFITTRSRNGHVIAIYMSGAYALWVFVAVCWAVLVLWQPASCAPAPAPVTTGAGCALPSH